jgi:hypothetical protein
MANLFDQFDSTQGGNPFDQFDGPKQASAASNPFDQFDGWDKAKGIGEAALNTVSSLASAIPTGIRTLGELAATGSLSEALDRAQSTSDFATYTPKTEAGKQYSKEVNDTMADYQKEVSEKFAGDVTALNKNKEARGQQLTPADYAAENTERFVGDLIGGLYAPGVPVAGVHSPIKPIDKALARAEELKAAQKAAENQPTPVAPTGAPEVDPEAAGQAAWNDMGAQLVQGQSDALNIPKSPMESMADDLSQQPARDAQASINARQEAMEQAVKQQQSLDFNAAERARQENAPLPVDYNDYRMQKLNDKFAPLLDAEQRQQAAQADLDSQGPIYVDPQGQAFRGDPNAPDARVALDNQTQAMDRELTHLRGQGTPEGEPLRPLQDPEMNAAKAEAQAHIDALPADEKAAIGLNSKPISSKGKMGRQRGAVNPEVFKEGFEKLKNLANGFSLKAVGYGRGMEVRLHAPDGSHVGTADFSPEYISRASDERNLESGMTIIDPPYQGKGLAGEMYKFASELGNDVSASKIQTLDGKKMWEGFQNKGISSNGKISRQRGAIQLFMKKTDIAKDAENFANGQKQRYGDIPEDPNPEKTLEQAHTEQDSPGWKGWHNYMEAGGILTAMKRGSTLIRDGARIVQNAMKRGDWQVRQFVDPTERAFRGLNAQERSTLWHGVLLEELKSNKLYHPDVISSMSPKMQAAYAHFRRMMDDVFNIQNEQRVSEGKPPITRMEAYVSSAWDGEYRRPLYEAVLDENGNPKIGENGEIQKKLVWYLAGKNILDLNAQTKALLKERPDLLHDPKEDHRVRFYGHQTDLQSAYTRMLDILGRDDPAVAKIKEAMEAQTVNQAQNYLNQTKHFEPKAGVRGFVGDRPGRNLHSEATAGLQQQLSVAKNGYRWAEMQKGAEGISKLINDPQIRQEQPNNASYLQEYMKQHLGYGVAPIVAQAADLMRGTGFSPSAIRSMIANAKSFFILQKLALNTKTAIMHTLQTANTLPHLTDVWMNGGKSLGHDPVSSLAVGIASGIALAGKHYHDFLGGHGPGDTIRPADRAFFQKAFKYAEDNMVTTHTIYNEAPIEKREGVIGRTGNALAQTMAVPETTARSVAFMSFVHALRGLNEFKGNDSALFQKAEELTYASMADYRTNERAMVFHKLGSFGNLLNTLQTYPMNQIHQWNYFARQAVKGNVAPLMAAFAVQYAMAGIMGLPGMDDIEKVYKYVKDNIISTPAYVSAQKSEFWSDPKLWMLHHWGSDAVDGWVSSKSGLAVSSSLRSVMPSDMLRAPGAPAADMAKQLYNLGNAAINPMVTEGKAPFSNSTLNAQLAMSSLPSGAPQGNLEQSKMMQGITYNQRNNPQTGQPERLYASPGNLEERRGVVVRTPQEDMLRRFGLRSERESLDREIGYRENESVQTSEERAKGLIKPLYDALRRGDPQRVADLVKAHVELTGQPVSADAINQKAMEEFTTGPERAEMKLKGAKSSVSAMIQLARMQQLLDQVNKQYGYGNK